MFVQIVPIHRSKDASLQRWGYIPQRHGCQSLMAKHFKEVLDSNIQFPWEHRSRGGKVRLRYRPFSPQTPASMRRQCKRREITEESPIMRKHPKVMKSKTLGTLDFRGFSPDEVKVNVTDEAVTVSAQREHPNASFQARRSLPLPPDSDKAEIVHRFVDGEVIVERQATLEGMEYNHKERFSEGNISDKQVENSDYECDNERPKATRNEETGEKVVQPDRTVVEDGSERLQPVERQVSTDQTADCETEGSNGKADAVDSESAVITSDVILTEVTDGKPDFKVQLDLSNYQPEDIRLRFKDGELAVEAERQIKGDNFSGTEKVTRHIHVPENVDETQLKSVLRDGVMTIRAPLIPDEKGKRLPSCPYPIMVAL